MSAFEQNDPKRTFLIFINALRALGDRVFSVSSRVTFETNQFGGSPCCVQSSCCSVSAFSVRKQRRLRKERYQNSTSPPPVGDQVRYKHRQSVCRTSRRHVISSQNNGVNSSKQTRHVVSK